MSFDLMTYFVTSWHTCIPFDVMTYISTPWRTIWRHDVFSIHFDVMEYLLMSWRAFYIITYVWRHDVLIDIMIRQLLPYIYYLHITKYYKQQNLLSTVRALYVNQYLMTPSRRITFCSKYDICRDHDKQRKYDKQPWCLTWLYMW